EELDFQIARDRKIEHHVDLVLSFFLGYLAERLADVFLEFGDFINPLDHHVAEFSTDAGLDYFEFARNLVLLAFDRRAQFGIHHLFLALFLGAGGYRAPGGARIVEVPMLERERKPGPEGCGLPEDRKSFFAASLQPRDTSLVRQRVLASRSDRVVQNGASGFH